MNIILQMYYGTNDIAYCYRLGSNSLFKTLLLYKPVKSFIFDAS